VWLYSTLSMVCYTLWDKQAVTVIAVPPILYLWGSDLGRSVLLLPAAWLRRADVSRHWRHHRSLIFGIALLSPLA